MQSIDHSRGYEGVAAEFIAGRGSALPTAIGVRQVSDWARTLPRGAAVLDLGCGTGRPITEALIAAGLDVHAIDAAPSFVEVFQRNFPGVPVACESVLESEFFGRRFDAVIAWGLVFLLEPEDQRRLIRRVGALLERGGRFLFTAPAVSCEWRDIMTGIRSYSLGAAEYRSLLASVGLEVSSEYEDAGENHYFDTHRRNGDTSARSGSDDSGQTSGDDQRAAG